MTERLTYTVEEAAEIIGLSLAGAYRYVRRGEIPSIRVGRRLFIPRSALLAFLDASSSTVTLPIARPISRKVNAPSAETAWDAALRRSGERLDQQKGTR